MVVLALTTMTASAVPVLSDRAERVGLAVYWELLLNLTKREVDVIQLLAQGRSNKDIARRLNITEGTAKTHVKSILTKLDAISRTEAVAVAHKRGLVHL